MRKEWPYLNNLLQSNLEWTEIILTSGNHKSISRFVKTNLFDTKVLSCDIYVYIHTYHISVTLFTIYIYTIYTSILSFGKYTPSFFTEVHNKLSLQYIKIICHELTLLTI